MYGIDRRTSVAILVSFSTGMGYDEKAIVSDQAHWRIGECGNDVWPHARGFTHRGGGGFGGHCVVWMGIPQMLGAKHRY